MILFWFLLFYLLIIKFFKVNWFKFLEDGSNNWNWKIYFKKDSSLFNKKRIEFWWTNHSSEVLFLF